MTRKWAACLAERCSRCEPHQSLAQAVWEMSCPAQSVTSLTTVMNPSTRLSLRSCYDMLTLLDCSSWDAETARWKLRSCWSCCRLQLRVERGDRLIGTISGHELPAPLTVFWCLLVPGEWSGFLKFSSGFRAHSTHQSGWRRWWGSKEQRVAGDAALASDADGVRVRRVTHRRRRRTACRPLSLISMALHTQSTVVVLCLIGSGHSRPEGGLECVDRDGVPCHPLLKADPCGVAMQHLSDARGPSRWIDSTWTWRRPWHGPKSSMCQWQVRPRAHPWLCGSHCPKVSLSQTWSPKVLAPGFRRSAHLRSQSLNCVGRHFSFCIMQHSQSIFWSAFQGRCCGVDGGNGSATCMRRNHPCGRILSQGSWSAAGTRRLVRPWPRAKEGPVGRLGRLAHAWTKEAVTRIQEIATDA